MIFKLALIQQSVTDGWTGTNGHHAHTYVAQRERKNERVGVEHVQILTKMVSVQILQKPSTHSPMRTTHFFVHSLANQKQLHAHLANVFQDQMDYQTATKNNIWFCVGGKPTNLVLQLTKDTV